MRLVRTRADVDAALGGWPRPGGTVALVPTLGALHAGHDALIDAAGSAADKVVVSIFVNPLQFGPDEDLAAYPRTLDDDLAHCAAHGVDVVFAPAVESVYPAGEPQVVVEPGPMASDLEGASRPAHFRGVLTVVTKLFGLVRPDLAVFGTKDYQQLALVRQCVTDLSLPVEIVDIETVRAADGLALSSRNRYLNLQERETAVALSRALTRGQLAGSLGGDAVLAAASAELESAPGLSVDYLALRGVDLGPAPMTGSARLLVAARVGSTRLIDNMAILLGSTGEADGVSR